MKKKFSQSKKFIKKGVLSIQFLPRNTFFTIHNKEKSTTYNLSNGKSGFKGSTRGTLYAGEMSAKILKEKLIQLEFTHLYLNLQGFNRARRKILRVLTRIKIEKLGIFDKTSYAYNGCRLKKQRRRKMRRKKL